MEDIKYVIANIMQVTLLNVVLSFDSISVIALLTKNLPIKFAKWANIIGISIAVICTILLTSIIGLIMNIQWFPIPLIGGILLIKITVDLVKSDFSTTINIQCKEEIHRLEFLKAIFKVAITSLTLSFDNVLAIAGAADGNVLTISYGLLISLPIIIFTSPFILKVIRQSKTLLYLCGSLLVYTAFEMILSYKVISPYIPTYLTKIIPFAFAVIFIISTFIKYRND